MTITGERRVDQSRWVRFRKEIKVPKDCKTNEITAKLTGGVLYIFMPKKSKLPSSQDQVTEPGKNPESEQTNPEINQDNVTKNLAGAVENDDTTTRNAIMLLTDAVFRLKMRKKMGLNVALAVVFMVAFVIYKNRQPPRVEN
ncbi:HEAT SHOCK PROTEIN 26 [Salix purpurea]|nr:HEAT SHOCK PROTEIN 26 [Salix purpurea]